MLDVAKTSKVKAVLEKYATELHGDVASIISEGISDGSTIEMQADFSDEEDSPEVKEREHKAFLSSSPHLSPRPSTIKQLPTISRLDDFDDNHSKKAPPSVKESHLQLMIEKLQTKNSELTDENQRLLSTTQQKTVDLANMQLKLSEVLF